MATINHPLVGRVSYSVNRDGSLRLDPQWQRENIQTVLVPQLRGVSTYGRPFSGRVPFYKPAIPQLLAAFAEVERAGLVSRILFWSGSFVPRLKRGGRTPSNHSWGTAFDLNHQQNPFRRPPAAKGTSGSLYEVAPLFEKYGFTWGGRWRNTPDGMHFEVKQIITPRPTNAVDATSTPTSSGQSPSPFTLNGIPLPSGRFEGGRLVLNAGDYAKAIEFELHQVGPREFRSWPSALTKARSASQGFKP